MIIFKGRQFPKDLILMAVRWKLAYPLSYRNIEELMAERGADVDHSTVQKLVIHYAPQLDQSLEKGQLENAGDMPAWKQFYELAA